MNELNEIDKSLMESIKTKTEHLAGLSGNADLSQKDFDFLQYYIQEKTGEALKPHYAQEDLAKGIPATTTFVDTQYVVTDRLQRRLAHGKKAMAGGTNNKQYSYCAYDAKK